jgi:glycerol-3-phosphate dehydrogenase (NAD(P)+)
MAMYDFSVLGGGAMGTSMAYLLSTSCKRKVLMWVRNEAKAKMIQVSRENVEYLPNIILPSNVTITSDLKFAVAESNRIVFAVPSHAAIPLFSQIKGCINVSDTRVLSAVKGLECNTGRTLSKIACAAMGMPYGHFAVLCGPNFASELADNSPSVMVIASSNTDTIYSFKDALESKNLIIYPSNDVVGVEASSVLKNVIAIAIGIVDGLGFGSNTRGAIFTASISEALNIGMKTFGAKVETILGPACLGDAITTGFSTKSRNYLFGLLLAKRVSGNSESSFLCEGKNNIRAIRSLVQEHGLNAPVTEFVYEIINGANAYLAFSSLWSNIKSIKYE